MRPKQQPIQPFNQDTDDSSGKPERQPTHMLSLTTARTQVVFQLFVFILIIAAPFSVQAGFFSTLFTKTVTTAPPATQSLTTATDIPLLMALQNPNPLRARGGAEVLVEDNSLVSTGPVGADVIAKQKTSAGEIRVYTVREGDSLSQIAEMFGVTTKTIMWANDIAKASAIQPGDSLIILPIVGVRYRVESGDTIASIAKKYQGDTNEIISYNKLKSDHDLVVGNTIIIPGGQMYTPPTRVTPARVAASRVTSAHVARVGNIPRAKIGWLVNPAPGAIKTQGIHGYNAVDLAGAYGSPIHAAAAGEVIVSKSSGWNGGYGHYVVIRHPNGVQTLYGHLMRNDVAAGDYVAQGEVIGGMGSTGKSTGTHVHFEVRGASNPF